MSAELCPSWEQYQRITGWCQMVALLSATSIIEGYYMRASNIHNLNYLTFLVIF